MTAFLARKRTRIITRAAISRGALVRQPCAVCGLTPTDAHHTDYAKPLDVRWLCGRCHRQEHKLRPMPDPNATVYLLQTQRELWNRFRERLREDGLKVGDTIRALIDQYIEHGLEKPKKKDK